MDGKKEGWTERRKECVNAARISAPGVSLLSLAVEETTLNYKLNASVQESLRDSAHKTLRPHFSRNRFPDESSIFHSTGSAKYALRPFLRAVRAGVLRPALCHLYHLPQKSLSFKLAEA